MVRIEQQGPSAAITDGSTRMEFSRVWGAVRQLDSDRITRADLTALERRVLAQMPQAQKTVAPTVGSSSSAPGGGGLDLRPLDNVWTGKNTFDYLAIPADKKFYLAAPSELVSMRFDSLGRIRFASDKGDHLWIGNDGSLAVMTGAPLWLNGVLNDTGTTVSVGFKFNATLNSIDCLFPTGRKVRFDQTGAIYCDGEAHIGGTIWTNGNIETAGSVSLLGTLRMTGAATRGATPSLGAGHIGYVRVVTASGAVWLPCFT